MQEKHSVAYCERPKPPVLLVAKAISHGVVLALIMSSIFIRYAGTHAVMG